MDHSEIVALIQQAVSASGGVWADLGAGTGNFTRALRELLGPQGTVYAIDRDAKAIQAQRANAQPGAALVATQADITHPLALPPLDGLLMANVLHFIRDQPTVLAQLVGYLKPGGRCILVEYELSKPVMWGPFPVPFARFAELAPAAGLQPPTRNATRRSPSSGTTMYAAFADKPRGADER